MFLVDVGPGSRELVPFPSLPHLPYYTEATNRCAARELWSLVFCLFRVQWVMPSHIIEVLACWKGSFVRQGVALFGVQCPCPWCGLFGGSIIVEHLRVLRGLQWSWNCSFRVLRMSGLLCSPLIQFYNLLTFIDKFFFFFFEFSWTVLFSLYISISLVFWGKFFLIQFYYS